MIDYPDFVETSYSNSVYLDIGDLDYYCKFCGAQMWYDERLKHFKGRYNVMFSLCCSMGKIKLPQMDGPPQYLKSLIFNNETNESRHFCDNIRNYNMMFSFTSMGGKIDKSINTGRAPPIFRLNGQNHHLIGVLLPTERAPPKFAQLYVHDTANEVANRISAIR